MVVVNLPYLLMVLAKFVSAFVFFADEILFFLANSLLIIHFFILFCIH